MAVAASATKQRAEARAVAKAMSVAEAMATVRTEMTVMLKKAGVKMMTREEVKAMALKRRRW